MEGKALTIVSRSFTTAVKANTQNTLIATYDHDIVALDRDSFADIWLPWPRDTGMALSTLDAFIRGEIKFLPPDTLQALTKTLWNGTAEYDGTIDRLRSTTKNEPVPMGIRPPPITESLMLYKAGPAQTAHRPVKDSKPVAAAPRPGWVGSNRALLPLSGAQPTWPDPPPASSRWRMTQVGHRCLIWGDAKHSAQFSNVVRVSSPAGGGDHEATRVHYASR